MTLGRLRDERGATAVELAMLAPGFLFLIFFAIQASLYFYGRAVAIQAAREGVSQLRLAQDPAVYEDIRPTVVAHTESFAHSVGREALLGPQASPTYDDGAARVTMRVTGRTISLVPGLALPVTVVAEGPVERFNPDSAAVGAP